VIREERRASITVRWKGGAITDLVVALPRHQPAIRTDEETIEQTRRDAPALGCAGIARDAGELLAEADLGDARSLVIWAAQ